MIFNKYTALGNVYIVIDPNKTNFNLTTENIKLICDLWKGIGSDGIIYGPLEINGKIGCRIFNPDGSEAEKSGNGTRIFGQYLIDNGYVSSDIIYISTIGGDVKMTIIDKSKNLIESEIGQANFNKDAIGAEFSKNEIIQEDLEILDRKFKINCVSMGNPHCVIILDEISEEMAKKYGPVIENQKMFKNKINVQFVKILDKHSVQLEIWERGAGYTMSSGTSSAAVIAVLKKLGYIKDAVTLKMPGGIVEGSIDEDNKIKITGTVQRICEGECYLDLN